MITTVTKNDSLLSWIKCPACGRRKYYYRLKTDDYVCTLCPTLFCVDFKHKIIYAQNAPKESK